MRGFQDKMLASLESVAEKRGFELVRVAGYANTGRVMVQKKDSLQTFVFATYEFNSGHNIIRFDGADLGDHFEGKARAGQPQQAWLFKETEYEKIAALLVRWEELVLEAHHIASDRRPQRSPGSLAPGMIAAREQHAAGINR
jgi:hypothetical protein